MSSEASQPPLNGAYVAVPGSPAVTNRVQGRRRFRKPFKVVVHVAAALSLAALVVWLSLRHKKIKVHVTEATMTQFELTAAGHLRHSLSLSLAFKNTNKMAGVSYELIHTIAYYKGRRFAYAPLPAFHQGSESTVVLRPMFEGLSAMDFRGLGLDQFQEGPFDVELRIRAWMRYETGFGLKSSYHMAKIRCDLKRVSLAKGGDSFHGHGGKFKKSKCHVHF